MSCNTLANPESVYLIAQSLVMFAIFKAIRVKSEPGLDVSYHANKHIDTTQQYTVSPAKMLNLCTKPTDTSTML